ncbi:MAG: replication-associated recombination protein A [Candidatus Bipolaricaulaceae bacterium]
MNGLWQNKTPLAERLRPGSLSEVVGQQHLLGPDGPLRAVIEQGTFSALLFWGPPGTGKTTVGRLMAQRWGVRFVQLSAALTAVAEVKRALVASQELWQRTGQRDLLFLDEIHRWSRAQQDVLLPFLEQGSVLFIGATTENPSFALRPALLSRAQLYVFHPLGEDDLRAVLQRALADPRGFAGRLSAEPGAADLLIRHADGDARRLLSALERAAAAVGGGTLARDQVAHALGRKAPRYDRAGEEHYNLISALHKSVRNSDVDGALYWLARMLESGEDPRYLARRLVRMASEDVGLADPHALRLAVAAAQAVELVGMPECELALAQVAVYLALVPKSNALYRAYGEAKEDVQATVDEPVPLHLRNPVTDIMRGLGYGEGYQYAHDLPEGVARMSSLPPGLVGRDYYRPTDAGWEARVSRRLTELRRLIRGESDA